MRFIGPAAGLAAATQIAYLTWPNVQGMVAAILFGLLIHQLWSVRAHLNVHVDMIVLMTAFGGFGMLPLPGSPACHVSTAAFAGMNLGMLALGVPPMLIASRCMIEARRSGRLIVTLAADVIGMLAGMITAHAVTPVVSGAPLLHHASMLLGMIAGMGLSRWLLYLAMLRRIRGVAR